MLQAKFHFEHVTQSTDCSPSSYANQRQMSVDLDRQIAGCKEEANWLDMFRLLLWKGQLRQVVYAEVVSQVCNHGLLRFSDLCH